MSLKHFNSLCIVIIRFIKLKNERCLKGIPRFCRLINDIFLLLLLLQIIQSLRLALNSTGVSVVSCVILHVDVHFQEICRF